MKADYSTWRAGIDRRSFIGRSSLTAAGLLFGRLDGLLAQDAKGLPMSPVVQTASGRFRGLVRYGVSQYWGVPYGATTAGPNRFMPPVKPAAKPTPRLERAATE